MGPYIALTVAAVTRAAGRSRFEAARHRVGFEAARGWGAAETGAAEDPGAPRRRRTLKQRGSATVIAVRRREEEGGREGGRKRGREERWRWREQEGWGGGDGRMPVGDVRAMLAAGTSSSSRSTSSIGPHALSPHRVPTLALAPT